MTISPYPLVAAIIGLVLYLAFDNKIAELGRILFFVGILALLIGFK